MNMQHVIKINNRVHTIRTAADSRLTLNSGKAFAIANLTTNRMIIKHTLTGRFMAINIK